MATEVLQRAAIIQKVLLWPSGLNGSEFGLIGSFKHGADICVAFLLLFVCGFVLRAQAEEMRISSVKLATVQGFDLAAVINLIVHASPKDALRALIDDPQQLETEMLRAYHTIKVREKSVTRLEQNA